MTTNQPTDPRIEQALGLIARVGGILTQAESILSSAEPKHIPRLDVMVRGLTQAMHNLAVAYNAALADVKLPVPAQAPTAPTAPAPSSDTQRTEWGTDAVHPLARRWLDR
jgi:hypothetical protein